MTFISKKGSTRANEPALEENARLGFALKSENNPNESGTQASRWTETEGRNYRRANRMAHISEPVERVIIATEAEIAAKDGLTIWVGGRPLRPVATESQMCTFASDAKRSVFRRQWR